MNYAETAAFLATRETLVLCTHQSPDADGLGAEYALCRALRATGRNAIVANTDRRPAQYAFLDPDGLLTTVEELKLSDAVLAEAAVVLVDTNDVMFAGNIVAELIDKAAELVIIDHHELKGSPFAWLCTMPEMSSTCEMMYHIVMALGASIEPDMAQALFTGMVFDTGSFAFPKTRAATFEVAGNLVTLGADPYAIHRHLYESSDLGVLLLRKGVLASLELYESGTVAVQTLSNAMMKETGTSSNDAEGLVNVPLQARSVQVSVLIRENDDGTLRCSMRAKGQVNVAQIAQSFGGGGHRNAAGFRSDMTVSALRETVLHLIHETIR